MAEQDWLRTLLEKIDQDRREPEVALPDPPSAHVAPAVDDAGDAVGLAAARVG